MGYSVMVLGDLWKVRIPMIFDLRILNPSDSLVVFDAIHE